MCAIHYVGYMECRYIMCERERLDSTVVAIIVYGVCSVLLCIVNCVCVCIVES